jgi:hypothetical protein
VIVQRHFETLEADHPNASLAGNQDGTFTVRVPGIPLPPGWNRQTVDIAFVVPTGYPLANPDCFWAEPDLALASGGAPKNTGQSATPGSPPNWLWFSWHPGMWDPNGSDLGTYLRLVRRRLAQPE